MTCLVFDHSGRHLHFIDGAEGGLSMAAKALKERAAKLGRAVSSPQVHLCQMRLAFQGVALKP